MFKKLYMLGIFLIGIKLGIEEQSFEDAFWVVVAGLVFYYFFKIMFKIQKNKIQSAGGFGKWFMSIMDTSQNDKAIMDKVMREFDRRRAYNAEESRKAQERYDKKQYYQNQAMYNQYYANKNKGTYDGMQSQNRANDYWNKANNL